MVKKSETALSGMGEISAYFRRSEPTILHLIRTMGFPAKKIGGIWESSKNKIDQWREEQL